MLRGGPPSHAVELSARALITDDGRQLGLVGLPLTRAEEKAIIARHWTSRARR